MKTHMIEVLTAIVIVAIAGNGACKERSGLIFSFGPSLVPVVHTRVSGVSGTFANQGSKLGINLGMGYAVNHRQIIVLMADAVFPENPEGLIFIGPMYFHYLRGGGNSAYLVGGLGLQLAAWPTSGMGWSINIAKFSSGPGVRGGIGYEFTPRVQCDLLLSIGRTSRYSSRYTHTEVSLNLRFPTY
jgi:hypothetical protein